MAGSHLIVTVHGIRTFGQWQERLEELIASDPANQDVEFVNYKYGYFSILAFIIPFFRWLVVRRFRQELIALCKSTSRTRVDLVGHSFGTHVIAWAVAKLPDDSDIAIDTIILSGSVLRSSFPWRELIGRRVKRVVNDCGSLDAILLLSQFLVLFTGMAGRTGFSGATSSSFRNRYSLFGHSGYFLDTSGKPSDAYMSAHWVPLLAGGSAISLFDYRKPSWLDGLVAVLGNNAEPVKLGVYVTPFIMISFWIYGLYVEASVQRDRALVTQSQLAAELAEQRIANGDAAGAALVALDAMPDDIGGTERKYVDKNAVALARALVMAQPAARLSGGGRLGVFSPDGKWLAVGTQQGATRIYQTDTWALVATVQLVNDGINVAKLAFSPSGRYLAVGYQTNRAALYRTDSGQLLLAVEGLANGSAVTSISFSPDERSLLTSGENLVLTAIESKATHKADRVHPAGVLDAAFSPEGSYILTTGARPASQVGGIENVPDQRVHLLSSADLSPVATLDHGAWAQTATFSPDGKQVATAGDGRRIRLWDVPSGKHIRDVSHESGLVKWVYFIDRETIAITSNGDLEVLSSLDDGRSNRRISTEGLLAETVVKAGGRMLLVGKNDQFITVFDPRSDAAVAKLSHRGSRFDAVAANDAGTLVAGIGASEIVVWRWPPTEEQDYPWPRIDAGDVEASDVSADGTKSAAILKSDPTAILAFDRKARNEFVIRPGSERFVHVVLSPDGNRIASSGIDRTGQWLVHKWSGKSGADEGVIARSRYRVENLVFSRDGGRLAVSFQDGTMRLYATESGEQLASASTQSSYGTVDLSPDGRFLVRNSSINDKHEVLLLDSADKSTRAIPIPDKKYHSFSGFLNNGWLVVAGQAGRAEIIEPAGQRSVGHIGSKGEQLQWVVSSEPRGDRVAAIAETGALYVWNASLDLVRSIRVPGIPRRFWIGDDSDVVMVRLSRDLELWSLSRAVRIGSVRLADKDSSIMVDWPARKITATRLDGSSYRIDLLDRIELWEQVQSIERSSPRDFIDFARAIALDVSDEREPAVQPSPGWWMVFGRDARDCDRLASNPFDPNRKSRGVAFERLDGPAALQACGAAHQSAPGNVRIAYQYGRALSKLNRIEESKVVIAEAASNGYAMARYVQAVQLLSQPAERAKGLEMLSRMVEEGVITAYADLGAAYFEGSGVTQDRARAMQIWQLGADKGDPRSHERLGNAFSAGVTGSPAPEQAFFHYAVAAYLYDRLGIADTMSAAKRGSLARGLPPASVIKQMHKVRGAMKLR